MISTLAAANGDGQLGFSMLVLGAMLALVLGLVAGFTNVVGNMSPLKKFVLAVVAGVVVTIVVLLL